MNKRVFMKKKLFSIVRFMSLLALMMPLNSCEELGMQTPDVTPEISVPAGYDNYFIEDLSFGAKASNARMAFQINVDWTMQVVAENGTSVSWCSIDPASGNAGMHKVKVSVTDNDTYAPREAKLQLMSGEAKVAEIVVSQGYEDALLLGTNEYNLSYEATTIEVELNTTVDYDYSIADASWLRKREDGSRAMETYKLTFEVDENISSNSRVNYIYFYNEESELYETVVINQERNPNGYSFYKDGMYVCGKATADMDDPHVYAMTTGMNEVTNYYRNGLYEKYVVLEGGEDFNIVLCESGVYTKYGAELDYFDVSELADNPQLSTVKRGNLVVGEDAPAMRVDKTGLYHIVLDLNLEGGLMYPQVVVASVDWGVRGAMNGWGFTAFDAVEVNAETMTWKMENVDMPANGEFKFAYGHGWKIQLDDAGYVKASTNLGMESLPNGANIKVEKAGLYTITLTYNLNGGNIADGYAFTVECTKEDALPTELYMIGQDFGNWDWYSDGIVEFTPVHSHSGAFWTTRYIKADSPFKFCPKREWSGDFFSLGNDFGYEAKDGNCFVAEDGFYTIYVDLEDKIVAVEPAAVYGMGECFGGWDTDMAANKFVAEGTTLVSPAFVADGHVRMYTAAPSVITGVDWWQMEFIVLDGAIVYRGAGGDQERVAATTGQKVTLDFNAGTGTIN